jgi:electron transfer flavoprotein beta subunit
MSYDDKLRCALAIPESASGTVKRCMSRTWLPVRQIGPQLLELAYKPPTPVGKGSLMVVLNRIYTRTGDRRETAVSNGERVRKQALRVEAYGSLGIMEETAPMKILVPVKRVIDYNVKARVRADGSGVDLANVKMSMNPFDEIAVEEAIRLKEKGAAAEVVVVSIGVKQAQETLRTALAMGADRAILVVAADDVHQDIEPLAVAKLLKAVVDQEQPGLVIAGKQAIDNDMNATGQMLAALLDWGQATFASKLEIANEAARVTREVDGGLQTIEVRLPAIVTADLRLNEPRYASLPNIMKAKKKPLEEKTPADYGVDVSPRLEILSTREPEGRQAGIKVGSVDELVSKLKEAGVI